MSTLKLEEGEKILWQSKPSFLIYFISLLFPLFLVITGINYFIISYIPYQYLGAFIFILFMFNLPSIILLFRIINYFSLSYFITNNNLIIRSSYFTHTVVPIVDIKKLLKNILLEIWVVKMSQIFLYI